MTNQTSRTRRLLHKPEGTVIAWALVATVSACGELQMGTRSDPDPGTLAAALKRVAHERVARGRPPQQNG